MKESMITKLGNTLLIALALDLTALLGLGAGRLPEAIPFIYTILMFCSLVVFKAVGGSFPFYFHVGQIFLLMTFSAANIGLRALCIGVILADTLMCIISLIKSCRKKLPIKSESGFTDIWKHYICRIKKVLNNSKMMCRILFQCMTLFVAAYIGYLCLDIRGHWIVLACSAVLSGEEISLIHTRGYKRFIGSLIGFCISMMLLLLNLSVPLLIAVWIIAFIIPWIALPHKKFIVASIFIELQAIIGNAIVIGRLESSIFIERFGWSILGIIIAIAFSQVTEKYLDGLENKKEM